MNAARLPRDKRRRQLLDVGLNVVVREGAERLTLPHLAECAGVSRPVVYDHFATREAQLLQLWQDFDDRLLQALQIGAVSEPPSTRARGVAALYVGEVMAAGPHCAEVSAALSGLQDGRKLLTQSRQAFAEFLQAALCPAAADERLSAMSLALAGALDALAQSAAEGHLSLASAADTFAAMSACCSTARAQPDEAP